MFNAAIHSCPYLKQFLLLAPMALFRYGWQLYIIMFVIILCYLGYKLQSQLRLFKRSTFKLMLNKKQHISIALLKVVDLCMTDDTHLEDED